MWTREQLLEPREMPRQVVAVPEFGPDATVAIRGLSGLEWADYNDALLVENTRKQRRIETRRVQPCLVVRGVIGEKGERLLQDADWETVGKHWPAAVVQRLYLAIATLSGAGDEEPEKNSASVPAASSSIT